jgi:competence CoiA-like predicted nuclease
MQLAKTDSITRSYASPGVPAWCPCCGASVIAKCGDINAWHWAHKNEIDCDPWSEPESWWHYEWKLRFPEEWREVNVADHRADIALPSGWVIELQKSSIQHSEIIEREDCYGNLIWVLDGQDFKKNITFSEREWYITFRWRWPRRSWQAAHSPLFMDFGGANLFRVRKLYFRDGQSARGWGRWVSLKRFIERAGGRLTAKAT